MLNLESTKSKITQKLKTMTYLGNAVSTDLPIKKILTIKISKELGGEKCYTFYTINNNNIELLNTSKIL